MSKMTKDRQIVKECIAYAKKRLGPGWVHVSVRLRWGLVCAEIVDRLLAVDPGDLSVEKRREVADLLLAACAAADRERDGLD